MPSFTKTYVYDLQQRPILKVSQDEDCYIFVQYQYLIIKKA